MYILQWPVLNHPAFLLFSGENWQHNLVVHFLDVVKCLVKSFPNYGQVNIQ